MGGHVCAIGTGGKIPMEFTAFGLVLMAGAHKYLLCMLFMTALGAVLYNCDFNMKCDPYLCKEGWPSPLSLRLLGALLQVALCCQGECSTRTVCLAWCLVAVLVMRPVVTLFADT